MGTKQTSIYMDERQYQRFKDEASKQQRSINWLFNQVIEFYLDDEKYSGLVRKVGRLEGELKAVNQELKRTEEYSDTEIQKFINESVERVKTAPDADKENVARTNADLLFKNYGIKTTAKKLLKQAGEKNG